MMSLLLIQVRDVYTHTPSIFSTASPDSGSVASLGWLLTGIAIAITLFVVVIMLIALARRRQAPLTDGPPLPVNELGWVLGGGALMPMIILGAVFVLSISVMGANRVQHQPYVDIEVIGHQWWWEVRYPKQSVVIADEIHIPVGESVRVHLTTADVLHSFWVPNLNGKVDLITGHRNTIWLHASQPGTFRGECAEYCGQQHAHMDFSVVAQPTSEFLAWLDHQRRNASPPEDSVTQAGYLAFQQQSCGYCHTIRGTHASGQVAPDLTHVGSQLTLAGGAFPNSPGYLGGWILNPDQLKPGTKMPPVPMDGASLNALVTYLESLK